MRCLIWGAGAIGGTIGAYLVRAGHDITLVDVVSDHVTAVERSGLRITGPIASFAVRVRACTPDAVVGQWDTVVLATKAHHTDMAVPRPAPPCERCGVRDLGAERAQ